MILSLFTKEQPLLQPILLHLAQNAPEPWQASLWAQAEAESSLRTDKSNCTRAIEWHSVFPESDHLPGATTTWRLAKLKAQTPGATFRFDIWAENGLIQLIADNDQSFRHKWRPDQAEWTSTFLTWDASELATYAERFSDEAESWLARRSPDQSSSALGQADLLPFFATFKPLLPPDAWALLTRIDSGQWGGAEFYGAANSPLVFAGDEAILTLGATGNGKHFGIRLGDATKTIYQFDHELTEFKPLAQTLIGALEEVVRTQGRLAYA